MSRTKPMHFHIKNSLRAYHRTQYNRVECDGAKFHVNLIREKHRENYWTAFLLLSSFNQCVPVSLSHYFISSYRLLFRSHWKWYFDVVAVTLYSSDHNLNLNCDAFERVQKKKYVSEIVIIMNCCMCIELTLYVHISTRWFSIAALLLWNYREPTKTHIQFHFKQVRFHEWNRWKSRAHWLTSSKCVRISFETISMKIHSTG